MKIDKVNLPVEITSEVELKPIQMDRHKLGKVVVIAGKNGSGKSRLLKLLQRQILYLPSNESKKQISLQRQKQIEHISALENFINGNFANKETNMQIQIESNKREIKSLKATLDRLDKTLYAANFINISPEKIDNSIIEFVPSSLSLVDSYTTSSLELKQQSDLLYKIGMQNISSSTIPAIDQIIKKWVNANAGNDSELNISQEEKQKINADYEKLKVYIKLFLGTELRRSVEGHAELFGKRIGLAELSNGQKILLQFCMALYAQEVNLDNLIIFMDEPENHLHPAALIEVIDKITSHVKNGQIWIATHSINVLAHFDPQSIWYMENGEISYAGDIPQKVLEGLLGNEDEIQKLTTFLSLPAQMASEKFAFESLFYPTVMMTGPEDPQVNQIYQIIQEKANKGEKLKVLDFGVGKGRLISTIYENERLRGFDVTSWLDFYGYDKFLNYKESCTKVLEDIFGHNEKRYFNEQRDLLAQFGEKTFDVIVMCNVFHEIEPSDWINLFTSVTSCFKLLKDDGFLLIVEDQFLAVGEKAHSKGFLVFDELEFKTLFKIQPGENYLSNDYRKDGRLKSHHIPKNCLERIDAFSKKDALNILLQNAKDHIKNLRQQPASYKNGRLHGFWSQQLANASLAIEEL